jgi:hypothetical protein
VKAVPSFYSTLFMPNCGYKNRIVQNTVKTAWKNDQLIGENRVIADHVKITNALFFNIFIARKLVKVMLEVANY